MPHEKKHDEDDGYWHPPKREPKENKPQTQKQKLPKIPWKHEKVGWFG